MRVGYELTSLELDATGTARGVRALASELAERIELVTIAQPGRGRGGRLLRGLARELVWFPRRLPRRLAGLGLDLLHCPAPLAPAHAPVPVVVTVPDAMAFERPEWVTRANALHARLVLRRALRAADAVITTSQHSRAQLVALLGLEPARVHVTHFGVDAVFSPGPPDEAVLARLGATRPYLLAVATLQPRKNLEGVLAAFEQVGGRRREARLVVVGARGWSDQAIVARLGADRVVWTGRVSDEDLVALYRGAECLVFPSRYEGFGLPPLEAMACGTPVVAARATSLPEVVGGAGVLVDPDDPDDIASGIEEALARREELAASGRARAAEFTWARCADQTVAVYEAVLSSARTTRQ